LTSEPDERDVRVGRADTSACRRCNVCPAKQSRAGDAARRIEGDQVTKAASRIAEHRLKKERRRCMMCDGRRCVNPVHRSNARPGRADLNGSTEFDIAKRKTAGTSERRSGMALRRGGGEATHRDQRALKGKKPHERSLAGPVDGLFSKSSSASVG